MATPFVTRNIWQKFETIDLVHEKSIRPNTTRKQGSFLIPPPKKKTRKTESLKIQLSGPLHYARVYVYWHSISLYHVQSVQSDTAKRFNFQTHYEGIGENPRTAVTQYRVTIRDFIILFYAVLTERNGSKS